MTKILNFRAKNLPPFNHSSDAKGVPSHSICIDVKRMTASITALVDEAIAAISSAKADIDPLLASFGTLPLTFRNALAQEGYLLEKGIALMARQNSSFLVFEKCLKLPLPPAALEAVRFNDSKKLHGIRFDSSVYAPKSYRPDCVLVHQQTGEATMIEVKRTLSPTMEADDSDLKQRMLVAGLALPDVLYREHKGIMIASVRLAIVDSSRDWGASGDGIWAMADIDTLLGVAGATDFIAALRNAYASKIDELLSQNVVGLPVVQRLLEVANSNRAHEPENWVDTRPIEPPSDLDLSAEGMTDITIPAKRKRGRPRKMILDILAVTESITAKELLPVRRKRGRPSKQELAERGVPHFKLPVAFPVVKRKRGRPAKHPVSMSVTFVSPNVH